MYLMNLLKSMLVCLVVMTTLSCGGESCSQEEWLGTYNIIDGTVNSACQNAFEEELVITANGDEKVFINGTSFDRDGCTIGQAVLGSGFQYKLVGSRIETIQGSCTATYRQ